MSVEQQLKNNNMEQPVKESIRAEKTTVDGLFAIARALHCVSDSIRDQTTRIVAVNQQMADAQMADTKVQAELLQMHKEKAVKG